MQHSAIQELQQITTSLQRIAADAHRERLARMAANAKPDRPINLHTPQFIEPDAAAPTVPTSEEADWVARQLEIHHPLKKLWFHVVEDLGPVNGRPSIKDVQRAVVSEFRGVTLTDVKSARRTAGVVRPRQVAMYLAKSLTLQSLPEIGRRFGGRDHTTVLHAVRKIEALVKTDPETASLCDKIKAAFTQVQS